MKNFVKKHSETIFLSLICSMVAVWIILPVFATNYTILGISKDTALYVIYSGIFYIAFVMCGSFELMFIEEKE